MEFSLKYLAASPGGCPVVSLQSWGGWPLLVRYLNNQWNLICNYFLFCFIVPELYPHCKSVMLIRVAILKSISISAHVDRCLSDKLWYLQHNRPDTQIPQCTYAISHNALFCNRNVHTCAHFCYKMVHCGIFVWCIMGYVICLALSQQCMALACLE